MIRIALILFLLFFPLQICYSQNETSTVSAQEAVKQAEMPAAYSWNFGQVKQGDILKHYFVLKNDSDKTLMIRDINTSCGCTASKAEKSELAPGESTSIEVQFKTEKYSGVVQQYAYVHTDSLKEPIIKLTIKADIVK